MLYRRLGRAGLKVSELSFGSWVTFKTQLDISSAYECMKIAYDSGVNFFDNAEVYAGGVSEEIMGEVLKRSGWRRSSYLVSTKLYWGLHDGPNERNTLNRKYLLEAIDGSLKRLQLDHVDLLFCHRQDLDTPIEETVRAMHDIITQGKALYWGTSEWSAEQIVAAYQVAEKYNLHKPQMEQPQYNMFYRTKVEAEFLNIFSDYGMGTTVWSPLASGFLTGKYNAGIPAGSRATLAGYEWLKKDVITQERIPVVKSLESIAREVGCTLSQLAISWCLRNENVSTVILGASTTSQLRENLGAMKFTRALDAEIIKRIEAVLSGAT